MIAAYLKGEFIKVFPIIRVSWSDIRPGYKEGSSSLRVTSLDLKRDPGTWEEYQSLHTILDIMRNTLVEYSGVGLSANQIGIPIRAFVIDGSNDFNSTKEYINPIILERSPEIQKAREGCLSIPGYVETVERHESIEVEYLDRFGKRHTETLTGFDAVAFQHEYDHLNGILYVDHLSQLKRGIFRKWFKKHCGKYIFPKNPLIRYEFVKFSDYCDGLE